MFPTTRPARWGVCVLLFAAPALALAGCQRQPTAPPDMPPPKVTVARPVSHPVQSYYEYNGHLDAVEMVEIKARVKGLLQTVHFVEGEEVEGPTLGPDGEVVKPGALLYTIDPREYRTAVARASADLAKATADIGNWQAQIKLAEADLGRAKQASAAGAAAQNDLDKARAMVDVNTAQLAVAEANKDAAAAALQTANIQLGYTEIRSPIAGRISRTLVTKGNLVGQDMPTLLTTIVGVDPLYVYFDAPERDLIRYQRALRERDKGAPVPADREAPVEVGVATEEGYPHGGRIDFRENRVDVGTGTVRLRGRIPNPPAPPTSARLLYPGLYARVRVPAGSPEPRPVIPEEALMTGQEGRFVFVLGPGEVVEKRVVTVGPKVWQAPPAGEATPGWVLADPAGTVRRPVRAVVAIEKGLTPTDRVVVVGLQKARPGAPVSPDAWDFRAPAPTAKDAP